MDRYHDNPNAPSVRFIRRNGRVIPLISGNHAGIKPRVASGIVRDQVDAMSHAVEIAERGQRIHTGYGSDHQVRSMSSSFPKFYSAVGFKNKADFRKVLDHPGAKQFRLMDQAVKDIRAGHSYGIGLPDRGRKFEIATREVFDNQDVLFRKINGKIRPMKIHNPEVRHVSREAAGWMDFLG